MVVVRQNFAIYRTMKWLLRHGMTLISLHKQSKHDSVLSKTHVVISIDRKVMFFVDSCASGRKINELIALRFFKRTNFWGQLQKFFAL